MLFLLPLNNFMLLLLLANGNDEYTYIRPFFFSLSILLPRLHFNQLDLFFWFCFAALHIPFFSNSFLLYGVLLARQWIRLVGCSHVQDGWNFCSVLFYSLYYPHFFSLVFNNNSALYIDRVWYLSPLLLYTSFIHWVLRVMVFIKLVNEQTTWLDCWKTKPDS